MNRKWARISVKLPKLKIPTKELPLIAIGITAVLISSLLRQPLVRYILIAIFFGVLSKETRWTYWGMFILIDAFGAFRFLLGTDRGVIVVDTIARLAVVMSESPLLNRTILSNSSIAFAEDVLVGLGNNPILANPVVIAVISIVGIVLGVVLWAAAIIVGGAYTLVLLPVFGHAVLMLYIFHRNDFMNALKLYVTGGSVLPYMARLATPYVMQGLVIQVVMITAILPLIFYKILKRIGFYRRIPGIQN